MYYWGKVLGVAWGVLSGLGFWGILIGLLMGYMFDKARSSTYQNDTSDQKIRQSLFFCTTFQVLGHLTKSKGRVTAEDIQIVSQLMDRMRLDGVSRTEAQHAFREGKDINYPMREKLRELRIACINRFDLLRMFLEIQIQAAFSDGILHPNERKILYIIAEELGISHTQFNQFLQMMGSGQQFSGAYRRDKTSDNTNSHTQKTTNPTLEDACTMIGVSRNDDVTTIKRAYRKRMSEHHPDKLVAKGLPPEMMQMAKQKTQALQAAYNLIKREKGFK
ncbi:Co-chaperone protein DjlA [Candidatus Erwinia haradaeae]|uniref:Co-chaperone protein DjlA n=1 Tax=Candidatus Erwinia haradaeae TaxID=1922217 RepID=A0A451DLN3_9GAMM|nr:co-chaperone DjlA [Candidatus Erwinia haradaeae]VFP87639.1 Co-chaperone protein DjlA [Candidatus Erwinia haradaeae]